MEPMKEKSKKSVGSFDDADVLLLGDFDNDVVGDSSDFDVSLLKDPEVEQKKLIIDSHQGKYKFMSEAEIRECQERDIKKISEILSVSRAEASRLLLHFKWNVNAVPEAWFSNGQKLREELGLLDFPVVRVEQSGVKDVTCGICCETSPQKFTAAALCGHIYCNICWAVVIKASLKDGLGCLKLQCPYLSCNAAVGQDMINMLAYDDDREIYEHYFLRSYIEYDPKAKWCPAPGCKFAVFLTSDDSISKVTCKCSNSFCWKCTKEFHQPISCEAVRNWEMGKLMQLGNWTLTSTKACPKCGKMLEVNGRFKRMECSSCKFQFCKLCLASWMGYGFWRDDQYTHVCSEGKLKQPVIDEDERERVTQDSRVRYRNLHSQWMSHEKDQQAALEELQMLQNGQLKAIADKQLLTKGDMKFVQEAWLQIADCKRVLKWACVYDYYLPGCEKERRFLFNYLLRQAENVLEKLYQSVSQLTTFFDMEEPSDEFINFRVHLYSQTSVARNFFNNMVWALENGYSDLNSLRCALKYMNLGLSPQASAIEGRYRVLHHTYYWNCAQCYFPNESSSYDCLMCCHR